MFSHWLIYVSSLSLELVVAFTQTYLLIKINTKQLDCATSIAVCAETHAVCMGQVGRSLCVRMNEPQSDIS